MSELSIGDVARRAGLATSAIRYYESEGLIPPTLRRSGRRVYTETILERLRVIHLAKRAGFSIAEIKRLLGGFASSTPPGTRWRQLAETKLQELEERIAEAERMRTLLRVVVQCECPTFSDCAAVLCEDESPLS